MSNEQSTKKVITSDVMTNACMMPFKSISDYPSIAGLENVVLSNGKVVNVVSDNYGFITNQDFFGGFERILEAEHIGFKAKYKNVNDCQFVADYLLEGTQKVGKNYKGNPDLIQPKIRLQNSYDGKIIMAGYFGFFRQVCENGLHVMKDELAFKLRRTSKNMEIVFPNMTEMLESYKSNEMIDIHRKFEVLAECTVKANDLEEIVKGIAESVKLFKFEKSDKNPEPSLQSQTVLNTIGRETDLLGIKPNAWIVYNAFNEWIYSDERNGKNEGMRKELDVKLFAHIEKTFASN